jgi:DNA polymerase-1
MEQKKLFLLDAYALIFRAYYALIRSPRFSSKGFNTSAIFGFVNTLEEVLKKENPTHIAVCFDPPGPTFRHEAYKEYKAQREATPEDIKKSVPYIKEIIKAYRIPILEVAGYEADDVIGTLAHKAKDKGFVTYMMTPDKDYGQLVAPNVMMLKPGSHGNEFEILGEKEVCEKYGIDNPLQVIDMLALEGDKADNIPGCPSVGSVTAMKLIKQFHSVEQLLANTDQVKGAMRQKVEENAEQIKFSKFLATIKTDVPVELDEKALQREEIDKEALRKIFDELEFKTLTARIIGKPEEKKEKDIFSHQETEPKTPKKEKTEAKQEPTLFDFNDADDSSQYTITTKSNFADSKHNYRLADDLSEVKSLAIKLQWDRDNEYSVYVVANDSVAMTARVIGIAFGTELGEATYVPLPPMGEERKAVFEALRPALESTKATYVSADVKHDMILLRENAQIQIAAPYYDTAVAHYLLQPETNHSTDYLANVLLNYETMPIERLIGPRGKGQKSVTAVADEDMCKYACEQADMTLRLKARLSPMIMKEGMDKLLDEMELPLVEVLADMEMTGVRVDVKALNEYSQTLTEQMNNLEAECYELAGEKFNTASPAQVGEVLFGKLKIDEKAKKTKGGQYSTTEEVLQRLQDRHPLVGKILELRGIRKLITTYTSVLPTLINPATGRIHTTYNQTVTATGRLSSTNPNLQNIPVRNEDGREIRKAFIPANGNTFFSADYSQIELRLVADLSKDSTMLEAFKEDKDIHAITASKIYHEPLESVTADQRRKAKTANFGILYGISAFGLAERLQIPRSEAKMLIDGYFETFPQVRDYIDKSIEEAKRKGYVTTLFGRRRMLPDINSRNAVVRSYSERNAINAPIQGTAADIIKIAMVGIYRRFKAEGLKSKLIMQVHDELNFDVVPEELDKVREIAISEMQGAYHGGVTLTASQGAASNWLEAH